MVKVDAVSGEAVKTYEVAYLLSPLVPDTEAGVLAEKVLGEVISHAGGSLIRQEAPKMITLAYPVRKVVEHRANVFRQAYFGWVRFSAPALAVAELKRQWSTTAELIRFLLLALPAEALRETVKRPRRMPVTPADEPVVAASEPVNAPKLEMDPAALDKQIDDLLTQAQV